MAQAGVSKGDRVALISANSPGWATVAFASYGLGTAVFGSGAATSAKHPETDARRSEHGDGA